MSGLGLICLVITILSYNYLKVVEMHTWSSDWKRVIITYFLTVVIFIPDCL
jgi:hypothetical protein